MDAIIERDNQWTYLDLDQATDDGISLVLYFEGLWKFNVDGPINIYLFRSIDFNLGFMRCHIEEITADAGNTIATLHYNFKGHFSIKDKNFYYLFDLLDFFKKNEDKLDERTASPIWT